MGVEGLMYTGKEYNHPTIQKGEKAITYRGHRFVVNQTQVKHQRFIS